MFGRGPQLARDLLLLDGRFVARHGSGAGRCLERDHLDIRGASVHPENAPVHPKVACARSRIDLRDPTIRGRGVRRVRSCPVVPEWTGRALVGGALVFLRIFRELREHPGRRQARAPGMRQS